MTYNNRPRHPRVLPALLEEPKDSPPFGKNKFEIAIDQESELIVDLTNRDPVTPTFKTGFGKSDRNHPKDDEQKAATTSSVLLVVSSPFMSVLVLPCHQLEPLDLRLEGLGNHKPLL
eukprot:scaffold175_cov177-Amphora_coffeaeformis.AAC.13